MHKKIRPVPTGLKRDFKKLDVDKFFKKEFKNKRIKELYKKEIEKAKVVE